MGRPKSRLQHLKRIGFKKGYSSPKKGKSFPRTCKSNAKRYERLTKESIDSRINFNTKQQTLTFTDVDGTSTNVAPLRPLSHKKRLIDDYLVPDQTTDHPDLLSNRIYCPKKIQDMFNSEIKQHCITDKCPGDLHFDVENLHKWGLVWSERLKCTHCTYIRGHHKLYIEQEAEGPGRLRRAASSNVGLQMTMMTTPIGNEGVSI